LEGRQKDLLDVQMIWNKKSASLVLRADLLELLSHWTVSYFGDAVAQASSLLLAFLLGRMLLYLEARLFCRVLPISRQPESQPEKRYQDVMAELPLLVEDNARRQSLL
jgi:hypothetical protein